MAENKKVFGCLDTKKKEAVKQMEDMLKAKYEANKHSVKPNKISKVISA
jgi:hypothetical protein